MRTLFFFVLTIISTFLFADERKNAICEKIIQKSTPPLTVIVGGPTHESSVRGCIRYGKFSFSTKYDVATEEEDFTYIRTYQNYDGSHHSTLRCTGYIRFYTEYIKVKNLNCQ